MKLTGPACTGALNEAEEAERRERAGDNAGGVRVERRVRPESLYVHELAAHSISWAVVHRGAFMLTNPKEDIRSYYPGQGGY
jgi:hypothetical protein